MIILYFIITKALFTDVLYSNFGRKIDVGLRSMSNECINILADETDLELICDDEKIIIKNGSFISIKSMNKSINLNGKNYSKIIINKLEITGLIGINNLKEYRRYRGSMKLIIYNGKIFPINIINVEEYLYGVIPCEISPYFPTEAIKAQVIAARTYMYKMLESIKYKECDLVDTSSSQVYKGYNVENIKFNILVNETFNKVLSYQGRLINAHFHSNSGGITANSEDVWGGNSFDYLKAVDDKRNYLDSAESMWEKRIYKKDINKKLGFNVTSIKVNKLKNERVISLNIIGNKNIVLSGEKFISLFNVESTLFKVSNYSSYFLISGKGAGHGVGLSQWGAYKLASRGYDCLYILKYYYKGIVIKDISEVHFKISYRSNRGS